MSFYQRLLRKLSQQFAPKTLAPPTSPVTIAPPSPEPERTTEVPPQQSPVQQQFNTEVQTREQIERNKKIRGMENWLRVQMPYISDQEALEIRLDTEGGNPDWILDPDFRVAAENVKAEFSSKAFQPQRSSPQYADMTKGQIEQFVLNQNPEDGLPAEISQNPRNYSLYEQVVQELREKGSIGNEQAGEDSQSGISSQQLTEAFVDNYLNEANQSDQLDDWNEDGLQGEAQGAQKRWDEIQALFPDSDIFSVLQNRVFREVAGGIDSNRSVDFRLKFFKENAPWLRSSGLMPDNIDQALSGDSANNDKSVYRRMAPYAEEASVTLLNILENEDAAVMDRVWGWVKRKLRANEIGEQYAERQNAVGEEGQEFDHSENKRVNRDGFGGSDESTSDERQTLLDAQKGDLLALGNTLKMLGKEAREYLMGTYEKEFGVEGPSLSKAIAAEFWADQANESIKELVDSNFQLDENKLKQLAKKNKVRFDTSSGRLRIQPAKGKGWDSVDFRNLLPLEDKVKVWMDNMINPSNSLDEDSYKRLLPMLTKIQSTKIDIERLRQDPKYREEIMNKLMTSKAVHAQMQQILTKLGDFLTSDEIASKYPPNAIMAYLDLLSVHSSVKKGGELQAEGPVGQKARKDLVKGYLQKAENLTGGDLQRGVIEDPAGHRISEHELRARRDLIKEYVKRKDRRFENTDLTSVKKVDALDLNADKQRIIELSNMLVPEFLDVIPENLSSKEVDSLSDQKLKELASGIIQKELDRRSNVSSSAKNYAKLIDRLYQDSPMSSTAASIRRIKVAVSRIARLNDLARNMSKFANIAHIDFMKEQIRTDLRNSLRSGL